MRMGSVGLAVLIQGDTNISIFGGILFHGANVYDAESGNIPSRYIIGL